MYGDEARQQYNERLRRLEHERMARQLQRLPQRSSLILTAALITKLYRLQAPGYRLHNGL
jgi:hypothetical protein